MSDTGRSPPPQRWHYLRHRLSLAQLQRVRHWQLANRAQHPMEAEVWDAVMTVWMIALIGWVPAFALGADWAYPLCLLGAFTPRLYLQFRSDAHRLGRLRCDWLDPDVL